ncbi:protein argonaute 16-like [Magnolia sinica]|uniref:protein argonaute 16-like n=1 Tax=Magnolia sinica TaxID=86752 RepID=UPI00265B1DB3|nr:protein argonaute 16-like [Magnolia sinica]XP_058081085.1 protein argonaute 16-like [Magnolia sinica]XP_058081086.1 protein argonaute 16-like [Magnolia sinica]XP_058081087.1 protein argonaute 16-like [Magnolia sinica]
MASSKEEAEECLPPPFPTVPPNTVPKHADPANRRVMARAGFGRDGRPISLLTNHFNVRFSSPDGIFFHYSVSITSDDNKVVEGKGIGRRVMDKVYQTYSSELEGKQFAYDGEKSLFTVGPLPQNNFEFMVVLEEASARRGGGNGSPGLNGSPGEGDRKRSKRVQHTRTFKVEISFAAKIPMKSIALALKGNVEENTQDALRVLDIILRQIAAKRGCLLVRQSFFHDDVRNFTELGGGVTGCRGFHSSFRTTQGGLSLNMDVSTTMILTPGPVIDFLTTNQNLRDYRQIDWAKAQKMLKNMRVKARHNSMEFKIRGLSEMPCNQQLFSLKMRNGDGADGDGQTTEITVYDYFLKKGIELSSSAYMPCLDVGKPKRPNYLPLELCTLVSLQRYTKALSTMQRSSLVEKSRQKPQERIRVVTDALRNNRYDEDVLLSACGISIDKQLTPVDGRVLNAPTLKVGNSEDCVPRNGRWNFNNKRLLAPARIDKWAVVNFSARCDISHLSRDLISCGRSKGIHIERPFTLIDEDPQSRRASPIARVERMFEQIRARLPGPPQFLLCVLPERKNSDIYGPWKKKNLHEMGIVTQCLAPTKINDQYLTNLLLKINSKLGGTNSLLAIEHSPCIPLINQTPTMILGMDVSHGSPGQSDIPSIAAVVGSRAWPLISRYRASVRTQSPKVEMIDSLFKPLANGQDDGIIRELLLDFYQTSNHRKPSQIVIFRDGVSESQFNQVLNIELDQIIKAFEHLGENWLPKFTVIVAQKNHHTKLFQAGAPDNVPPGTVVDSKVVHPRNYDFYMCAHAGMIGTSRPTHYHVLLDEIGFSPDDLQKLVLSLSYVYQRSTTAISIVAPISYAHLAAQQMLQFIKFEDFSDASSGHGGVTTAGTVPVPELPRLHQNVCSSMFFC